MPIRPEVTGRKIGPGSAPLSSESHRDDLDPDRVLTFAEWCKLCGFSEATGRRIIKSGKGPKVTWLSERRMGVRRRHNAEWLDQSAEQHAAA